VVLEDLLHELQGTLLRIELIIAVLVVMTDLQMQMLANFAVDRFEVVQHQVQQGRLARTVGSHEGNATIHVHPEFQAIVQGSLRHVAGVAETHLLERQDRGRQGLHVRESEVVVRFLHHLLGQAGPGEQTKKNKQ
jgi:hypothetical protein